MSTALPGIVLLIAWPAALQQGGGPGDAVSRDPLAPLTEEEHRVVLATLSDDRYGGAFATYPLITLREPDKDEVLDWDDVRSLPRRAWAVVRRDGEVFEAVVDVDDRAVTSWTPVPGVQPGILPSAEIGGAQRIVMGDPEWLEGLRRRGITSRRGVTCVPSAPGYFGIARESGRRLLKVVCYHAPEASNFWGRPIEGLIAVVDIDRRQVVDVIDVGAAPVPSSPVDFDTASVGPLRTPPRPLRLDQPEGPSFDVQGRHVEWQKWRFRFRLDPRVGTIVSTVRYLDRGRERSILYQGALSELFVPYMDPDVGWYFRTYLDAGEYGVGKLAVSLVPGVDCPPNAVFFDATFADDWGSPYVTERASCLFERYAGGIAWRHSEGETGTTETRRRTDLVLRSISAIGNYDYVFDWVFRQDGTIRVGVGATGVEQVKAVPSRTIEDDADRSETAFGRMVAEHTVAVNHDHFFSFRLDVDVDGRENTFVTDRLVTARPEEGPRRSLWVLRTDTAAVESDAQLRIDLERPALWRVINPDVRGPVGYAVSYQLKPLANAVSLLAPDDIVQRRAAFTDFHLWVTPFAPDERYAAGAYPNQSVGGRGIAEWTKADRPIGGRDLVLWYTVGFHHVVRAEDWPVLPTSWTEFELRPFDFFDRNPALDLPNP